jgi:hypothetical protein
LNSINDYGTTSSPSFQVTGNGSDSFHLTDTGSSTLTTAGHVNATDTYGYVENSSESASDTNSGSDYLDTGAAIDSYQDNDAGTITVSNTTTTSFDSFTLADNHSISGNESYSQTNSSNTETWNDSGTDDNALNAQGTDSSSGNNYSFADTDTGSDIYSLNKVVPYSFSAAYAQSNYNTSVISGSSGGGSFTYLTTTTYSDADNYSGNQTMDLTIVNGISDLTTTTLTDIFGISGPSGITTTYEDVGGESASGSGTAPALTEILGAGHADTSGNGTAGDLGTFPSDGAIHEGTTQPNLDTSQGLVSALGGQDAHPLAFVGAEISPTVSGSSMILQEPNETGSGGSGSWVTHPSAIGYRRQGTSSGSGGHGSSSVAAVVPQFDRGMSEGSDGEELQRITNFGSGTVANPTSAQSAPTPRAEQAISSAMPVGEQAPGQAPPGNTGNGGNPSPAPPEKDPGTDPTSGPSPPPPAQTPVPPVQSPGPTPIPGGPPATQQGGQFSLPSTDDVINTVDAAFAGTAAALTGGLSTRFRSFIYGEIASRNHQGVAFNAGQVAGTGLGLAIGSPCGLAPKVAAGLRGLNAAQAVGSAVNAVECAQNGDVAGAALNAAGAVLSARQLGGACFAAGTPILTPDGSKLIETIRPGDWVMAAPDDDHHGEAVPRQVQAIFENYVETIDLHVNGRVIRTTGEHPFWVRDRGWVNANQLEAGHELRAAGGRWVVVDRTEGPMPAATVYNMSVAEYHTYFVGHKVWGFAVWSHNSGICPGDVAPNNAAGKKLVRYGGPDTAEKLASDAAAAEVAIGHHGVSTMLRKPPSFPHGQADFGDAGKVFPIVKTGANPSHYTVVLPKPVTQAVADIFNSIFMRAGQ